MSISGAATGIFICQVIWLALVFLTLVGLFIGLLLLKRFISHKIDEVMSKMEPILNQTRDIAEQAKVTAEKVSDKVDSIMTKAESTADKVTSKVDTIVAQAEDTAGKVSSRVDDVSAKVDQAVNPQVATLAGYAATAIRVMQVYRELMDIRQAAQATARPRRAVPPVDEAPGPNRDFEPHI